MKIRRALISVHDKTGVVEFARALHTEFGIELISTGGTAKTLRDAGLPVTLVEEITGAPEMLDGRVKTLHPRIHAAILADRDNPEHMRQLAEQKIDPIDLVVVNLYPFENTIADPNCTFEQAIEMIDIGGVTLLRAAAKNHKHVVVITHHWSADDVLREMRDNQLDEFTRAECATKAYLQTSQYDSAIARWMDAQALPSRTHSKYAFPRFVELGRLRYGENSGQDACVYAPLEWSAELGIETATVEKNPLPFTAFGQPSLSYNNFLDADAALRLCDDLSRGFPAVRVCVMVKHTNPCGVGIEWGDSLATELEAYRRAYLGDPNAAMGGILACNFIVDAEFAAEVLETFDRLGKPLRDSGAPYAPGGFFLEVWVAPSFTPEARVMLDGKVEKLEFATDSSDQPLSHTRKDAIRRLLQSRPPKKWGATVRLMSNGKVRAVPDPHELLYRSITGGVLVQTPDVLGLNETDWKVASTRQPTEQEWADLRLAWLVCKHTKSNAITICRDGMLLGNGAGQMSRVMSCRVATWLARENGHLPANDSAVADAASNVNKMSSASRANAGQTPSTPVAASDAFFPFADGPRILIDAGVTAIIQPGGSKRDQDTIDLCNERGVALVMTGTRHFKH